MPKPDLEPTNLGSIARGALLELFEKSALKVAQNIADTSTNATAVRTITLKLKFKPDVDRRAVQVITTAECKTAGVSEHVSRAYIGKDDEGGVYIVDQDPRQDVLFQAPAQDQSVIQFAQKAQ